MSNKVVYSCDSSNEGSDMDVSDSDDGVLIYNQQLQQQVQQQETHSYHSTAPVRPYEGMVVSLHKFMQKDSWPAEAIKPKVENKFTPLPTPISNPNSYAAAAGQKRSIDPDSDGYNSDDSFHTAPNSPEQLEEEFEPGQILESSPPVVNELESSVAELERILNENSRKEAVIENEIRQLKERQETIRIRLLEHQVRTSIARNRKPANAPESSKLPEKRPAETMSLPIPKKPKGKQPAEPRPIYIAQQTPVQHPLPQPPVQHALPQPHPLPQPALPQHALTTTTAFVQTRLDEIDFYRGRPPQPIKPTRVVAAHEESTKEKKKKAKNKKSQLPQAQPKLSLDHQIASDYLLRQRNPNKFTSTEKKRKSEPVRVRLAEAVIDKPLTERYIRRNTGVNTTDNTDVDQGTSQEEATEQGSSSNAEVEPRHTAWRERWEETKRINAIKNDLLISDEERLLITPDAPAYVVSGLSKAEIARRENSRGSYKKQVSAHLTFCTPPMKHMKLILVNLKEHSIANGVLSAQQEEFVKGLIRKMHRLIEDYMTMEDKVFYNPGRLTGPPGEGLERLPIEYYGNLETLDLNKPDIPHHELFRAIRHFDSITNVSAKRKSEQFLLKSGRAPLQPVVRTCDPADNLDFDLQPAPIWDNDVVYKRSKKEKADSKKNRKEMNKNERMQEKSQRAAANAKMQREIDLLAQKVAQDMHEKVLRRNTQSSIVAHGSSSAHPADVINLDDDEMPDAPPPTNTSTPVSRATSFTPINRLPQTPQPVIPIKIYNGESPSPFGSPVPLDELPAARGPPAIKTTTTNNSTPPVAASSTSQASSAHFQPYRSALSSLGLAHASQPQQPAIVPKKSTLCSAESGGGVCNDKNCPFTHFKDYL